MTKSWTVDIINVKKIAMKGHVGLVREHPSFRKPVIADDIS